MTENNAKKTQTPFTHLLNLAVDYINGTNNPSIEEYLSMVELTGIEFNKKGAKGIYKVAIGRIKGTKV